MSFITQSKRECVCEVTTALFINISLHTSDLNTALRIMGNVCIFPEIVNKACLKSKPHSNELMNKFKLINETTLNWISFLFYCWF